MWTDSRWLFLVCGQGSGAACSLRGSLWPTGTGCTYWGGWGGRAPFWTSVLTLLEATTKCWLSSKGFYRRTWLEICLNKVCRALIKDYFVWRISNWRRFFRYCIWMSLVIPQGRHRLQYRCEIQSAGYPRWLAVNDHLSSACLPGFHVFGVYYALYVQTQTLFFTEVYSFYRTPVGGSFHHSCGNWCVAGERSVAFELH